MSRMKKLKPLVLVGTIMLFMFIASCFLPTDSSEASTTNPDFEFIGADGSIWEWRDNETGVHYLGNNGDSYNGGLCPKYNADGTLYVD